MKSKPFATAKLSPCAVAWLVRADDLSHFERVINHNCTVLGGAYNVLIPVNESGVIWPYYELFLALYDPDYVILAPGISQLSLQNPLARLSCYAEVPYGQVHQIIPEQGLGGSNLQCAYVPFETTFKSKPGLPMQELVAVANPSLPDASLLAFMACGDVSPTPGMWEKYGDVLSLDAMGYREMILGNLAVENHKYEVAARLGENDEVISAPDREKLSLLIKDEHKFPVSGAADILEACCRLQHRPNEARCFVGRTIPYHRTGTPIRNFSHLTKTPGMVILVSDSFGFQESVLFWNLRADGVLVSWLSFSQCEENISQISEWLNADFSGTFYTFGSDIVFASPPSRERELEGVVAALANHESRNLWKWKISNYDNLPLYDYERPHIQRKHISVSERDNNCSVLPEYPEKMFGTLGLTLEWPSLMLPCDSLTAALVSAEKKHTWIPLFTTDNSERAELEVPRFRLTSSRHVRIQISDDSPVEFSIPTLRDVVSVGLRHGGFTGLEEAQHAQYQHSFIARTGSLEAACAFLIDPPYREFFNLMANMKQNPKLLGWLLKDPPLRRALHQLALSSALDAMVPLSTADYFDKGEDLPEQARKLIEVQLLERGFQLKCQYCSSLSWYTAEEVGQSFTCHRCYSTQRIKTSPLWLYKLPEVVFQLFNNDAEIALLALRYLKGRAQHHFDFMLDSTVNLKASDQRNVDFSCLIDGRLLVGEAKSNDYVESDQFAFYEALMAKAAIDGIVFATSQKTWAPSTVEKIEKLKSVSAREVITLTREELFSKIG